MTTFYLGCSFSFDDKLVEAGVNLDFTANVSMYKTNVKCAPVGPFNANLVVSMRPIPKSLLQKVIEATIDLDFCHGAPVHIGRAKDIGIQMNSKVDFGSNVEIQQNYVPVFWACGVTGTEAVKSANLESTFTHSPGCMYVSDTLSEDIPSKITKTIYPKPIVVCLDDSLNRYSIISKQRYDTLSDIETICSDDVGNRGIETLTIRGDYHKAILSLSKSAKSVGIIVGFRCFTEGEPKEENDGVAGAIILARALVELGIDVCFFIDDGGEILKKTLLESSTQGFIGNKITVKTLGKDYDVHKVLINTETGLPNFTHLISIEKPCRSITGVYRTMKGRDISNECSELDKLFEKALEIPDIVTIGIGDGGNEIGMGKVKDKVIKHVEYGALIAAQTSCDYLIVCGVSDWGGYAISAGLYIARNCTVHDRYRRFGLENDKKICLTEEFFLSQEKDLDLRKLIRDRGFRDGITQIASLTVDNLSYEDVHLPKILSIQEKAKSTC